MEKVVKADYEDEKCIAGESLVLIGVPGDGFLKTAFKDDKDSLIKVFNNSFIDSAEKKICCDLSFVSDGEVKGDSTLLSIIPKKEGEIVDYFYELDRQSLYSGLWKVATKYKSGLKVFLKKIPVSMEIIEICEHYDVNPYLCECKSAALVLTPAPLYLVDLLKEKGINAGIIGYLNNGNDRVVVNGEQVRFLTPREEVISFASFAL